MDEKANAKVRALTFYLDGLRYCIEMSCVAVARLRETTDSVSRKIRDKEDYEPEITSALLDAWSVVDLCHRARELAQQAPGLARKAPAVKLFIQRTKEVEAFRHHVQHLRSGIPKLPESCNPVWGALSWVPAGDVCYTAFTGSLTPNVTAAGCAFDTHEGRFAQVLALQVQDKTLDLDVVLKSMVELQAHLAEWVDSHPYLSRGESKTLVFQFRVTEKTETETSSGP